MSTVNDFLLNLPLPLLDHWGYLLLFLLTIIEALPILGSFVPGQTLVMFGGFLAYLGVLRLDAVMSVAAVGAVVGDLLAYVIGRKYGHDFMVHYGKYFFLNQARYEKTRRLVQEHAGKTLVVGRFSPFTRALAAFVAGLSRVKFSRFIFFAVAGGVGWAVVSVLVGYIFGQGFVIASKYFGRFVLIAIIAIILIIYGYRFLDKRKHIFAKYHVYYLTLNVLSIYVFGKMAEDYFDRESTYGFDLWLDEGIHLIWQPWLNKLMALVTNLFSPAVLGAVALAAVIYFFIKRQKLGAGLVLIGAGGGLILGEALKWLVGRPRPTAGLIETGGFSFPSGHALMALIFFVLILYIFTEKIKNKWQRYLFMAGNLGLIFLVGFSRIYLKVHWFSDVVAGWALGLFWLTFLILVFRVMAWLFEKKS